MGHLLGHTGYHSHLQSFNFYNDFPRQFLSPLSKQPMTKVRLGETVIVHWMRGQRYRESPQLATGLVVGMDHLNSQVRVCSASTISVALVGTENFQKAETFQGLCHMIIFSTQL